MSIQVIGLDRVRALIGDIPDDLFSEELLTELGEFFVFKIKERTAEGKDVDGNLFAKYSPKWAAFRAATGHETDPVNLFFSGSMLGAMQVEALPDDKQVRIYFMDTEDKTGAKNALKAKGLNDYRKFFDLSSDEVEASLEIIKGKV